MPFYCCLLQLNLSALEGGEKMMNHEEAIEMLNILVNNAYRCDTDKGKECTVIDDVKLSSFVWVINEAITLLEEGD